MARNPEIRHRLTVEDFRRHHDRQVRLLCSAMRSLREGGRLIYSTCSLEAEENETVVAEALEREKAFRLLPWRDQIQALELEGTLHAGTAERYFPATRLTISCAPSPAYTQVTASSPRALCGNRRHHLSQSCEAHSKLSRYR